MSLRDFVVSLTEMCDFTRLRLFCDCVCLQRKKVLQEEAVFLLRSDNTVFDKALVLCQMHNFKEGILYLYEKGKL